MYGLATTVEWLRDIVALAIVLTIAVSLVGFAAYIGSGLPFDHTERLETTSAAAG